MCDFAADPAAAEQFLVGRVLTVKRIRKRGRRSQLAVSEGKCERSFD